MDYFENKVSMKIKDFEFRVKIAQFSPTFIQLEEILTSNLEYLQTKALFGCIYI